MEKATILSVFFFSIDCFEVLLKQRLFPVFYGERKYCFQDFYLEGRDCFHVFVSGDCFQFFNGERKEFWKSLFLMEKAEIVSMFV